MAGLTAVALGLGGTAVVIATVPASATGWAIAPTLLLGGVGGGFVISPNVTLALRDVPVHMAGSAGGALQTFQRFGAAIGTAALPGLFYLVLGDTEDRYPLAAAAALAAAVVGVLVALVIAAFDLRRTVGRTGTTRPRTRTQPRTRARARTGMRARTGTRAGTETRARTSLPTWARPGTGTGTGTVTGIGTGIADRSTSRTS